MILTDFGPIAACRMHPPNWQRRAAVAGDASYGRRANPGTYASLSAPVVGSSGCRLISKASGALLSRVDAHCSSDCCMAK